MSKKFDVSLLSVTLSTRASFQALYTLLLYEPAHQLVSRSAVRAQDTAACRIRGETDLPAAVVHAHYPHPFESYA